ncbi:futalosine hydrolase [Thermoflavimicrobium daqui]|jgi:futalosine hydrolase|uniref:Futalosine hydrolase n=1 Tax=Thermoflavimicrobium daqui TaxID=2137476 RepID=A0A364K431_9BACL|nr:futalosine hydrolase [Thermoflavimicrobium daqui]RAL24130.1 futalosine hydrolase [Thermoflavimicrobium daqui]
MGSDLDTYKGMRILVMTSVQAEKEAVLRGLCNEDQFDVMVAGVGSVAAAISTVSVLHTSQYDLVINAGIAGGFMDQAEVGSVVVADKVVAADLGAQTPEGFLSLDELGFGSSTIHLDQNKVRQVAEALQAAGLPVATGSILTLSTVTGTAATATALASRVQGAVAEAMEGFGIASAAQHYQIPFLEIRTISNPVGPRNRAAWRIDKALEALEAASSVLREVFK